MSPLLQAFTNTMKFLSSLLVLLVLHTRSVVSEFDPGMSPSCEAASADSGSRLQGLIAGCNGNFAAVGLHKSGSAQSSEHGIVLRMQNSPQGWELCDLWCSIWMQCTLVPNGKTGLAERIRAFRLRYLCGCR